MHWMGWADKRRHIDQIITDEGQWVGLCDGWGNPIMRVPPILSLTAPEARLSAASLSLEVSVDGGAHVPVHPLVGEMVADGLGVFDEAGRLVVKDQIVDMVVVARAGRRRGYVTSFPTVIGGSEAPSKLLIQGADLLDRLAVWPCPSVPQSWLPSWMLWTGDVVEYSRPRGIAEIEMAVVADGYTLSGPAEETIRTLVQDSLDAVNTAMGWEGSPHLVVDMAPTGRVSPEVRIRVQDAPVLDTIVPPAQMAGVNVIVDLWWPGDEPVLVRTPDRLSTELVSWTRPIGVVRVEQTEEV